MRWLTNQYINAGVTLLLGLMSTLGYSQVTANGSETLVNTTTADNQQRPEMAMDTSGNYVVVWESHLEDGDDYGIYAQLYNSDGTTNGGQITISQTTAGAQRSPDVDMDDNGDFTVVWMSYGEDNDGWGVYARRYNSDGTAKANDWRVNSTQTGNQMHPRVAVDDDGDIWFVWSDDDGDGFGVRGRHYTSAGAATSSPYWINTTTAGHQAHPDIACDANGNFTVVWQSHGQDGDGKGIFAQQFDNTRTMVGSEFQVNATTAENQEEPSIAMDDAGNFMVTWSSYAQDGDHYGVYGQIYDNTASVTVPEFQVSTTTAASQHHPSVAVISGSNYTVAWTSWAQDGDKGGVYTRSFLADGTEYQPEELVNTRTNDYQQFPTVGGREQATNMAIAWQDGLRNSASTNDGSNYGVYVQNYGVQDAVPPTAVCQDITAYLDGAGNVSITAGDVDGGSTDNIGITSYSLDISSFTCANLGANTVTLTVEDAAANSDNCTATVTVVDTISPTAVCQDITVYLDGAGNASITAASIDGGSTDNCGAVSLSADITAFTCANVGANTVTLTADDGNGNTSQCTSTVTVLDTISPTAVCQNVTVYLDGAGNASITAASIDGGSTDNCGAVSLSADITAFTCANIGANNVTLTADDGNGNTSQCVAVVTVQDTISPTAVCQNITVNLDGSGNATITAAMIDGGSTDNCGAVSLSASPTAFTCANLGANNVTLTVDDGNGNTSQCVAVVTIADNTAPTASCQDITVYLDGAGTASIVAADIDNGSTDNCGSVSLSADITSFTCANAGANTVTLTVDDGNGNSTQCTSTVTVLDTVSPTAVCQNITVYLDGAGNATITTGDIDNGSTDNCGTPTLSLDITSFTCANIGTNTVTLTATDGSANTSTCTATVTVADTTSPTASCQDITVYLDAGGNASIVAADIDGGSTDNCGSVSLSADITSFTCVNLGANTVTLTVTDGNSNTSTCTATVTLSDTISPTVSCPSNVSTTNDAGSCSAVVTGINVASSSDNCGSVSITYSLSGATTGTGSGDASGTAFNVGTTTVTYTADDGNGNTASCSFDVTVTDTEDPTLTGCPSNISMAPNNTGCTAIVTWTLPTEADNCTVTLTSTHNSGDTFPLGTTTVTYTATDGAGNTASCSFDVTITDDLVAGATGTDALCSGACDGTATANASGGTSPFSYAWDDPGTQTTQTAIGLCAGTYNVTVTDANGCSTSASVTIGEPSAVAHTATITNADCNGNSTGIIDIAASGGTIPYQYSIDGGITFQASSTFTGLGAGTYNVVVEDANGCQSTSTETITEPTPVTYTSTDVNLTCNGGGDGSIDLVAAGGNGSPYQYSIDGGTTFQASGTFTGLAAGTYNIVVEDVNGCQATGTITLTEPAAISIDNIATVDPSCGSSNGSITITASNGVSPYQYSIDGGTTFQASNSFAGLAAGSYSIVVEDANGCQQTTSASLTNPGAPSIDNVVWVDPTCNGDTDGSITITVSGGTTPYQYSIDNGVTFQAGNSFTGLPAGVYDILIEDAVGCQSTLQDTLFDPPVVSYTETLTHPTCNGATDGSIDLVAAGGDGGPYNYSIDNGVTFQASGTFTGLGAGTYNIVVEDASGCQATGTATLTEPPAVLIDSVTTVDPTCGASNGSLTIFASMGVLPYQYSIDGGATFQGGNSFVGLPAGTYNLVVEDANGCSVTTTTVLSNPGAPIIDSIIAMNPLCAGSGNGSIDIFVSGGTPPFQFSINNGVTFQLGGFFGMLGPGPYDIVVEDANGCQSTAQVNLMDPPPLGLSATTTDELMGGDGTIDLTVTGGTPPFIFDWDNDGVGDNNDPEDLSGLVTGNYHVIVQDANGCIDSILVFVGTQVGMEEPLSAMEINVFPNPNGGQFTVSLTGGLLGETYQMQVINSIGQIVTDFGMQSGQQHRVTLGEVERGVYYLRLINDDGFMVRKLIIQR